MHGLDNIWTGADTYFDRRNHAQSELKRLTTTFFIKLRLFSILRSQQAWDFLWRDLTPMCISNNLLCQSAYIAIFQELGGGGGGGGGGGSHP